LYVVKAFGVNYKVYKSSYGVPQNGNLPPILFSLFINSANRVLNHCRLLCFADDTKLIMQINSPDDYLKLQVNLNNFYKWSQDLGLSLNLDNCQIMTFTMKNSIIISSYRLNNTEISCIETILDLSFKFNSYLDPGPHTNIICYKTYKMLGFVKILAFNFKLGRSLNFFFHFSVLFESMVMFFRIHILQVTLVNLKWYKENF